MLCQFSFQNFKSYKDETTFDFRAMALTEFENTLIRQEKAEDLLPVSVIYGPNGGGKTNLLQAFFCLVSLVVKPIHTLEKNRQPIIFQKSSSVAPFMLDESSADEPTVFQVFFRVGEKEFQYYISIKEEIVFESLSWRTLGGKKTGLIFERDGQKIELGEVLVFVIFAVASLQPTRPPTKSLPQITAPICTVVASVSHVSTAFLPLRPTRPPT